MFSCFVFFWFSLLGNVYQCLLLVPCDSVHAEANRLSFEFETVKPNNGLVSTERAPVSMCMRVSVLINGAAVTDDDDVARLTECVCFVILRQSDKENYRVIERFERVKVANIGVSVVR